MPFHTFLCGFHIGNLSQRRVHNFFLPFDRNMEGKQTVVMSEWVGGVSGGGAEKTIVVEIPPTPWWSPAIEPIVHSFLIRIKYIRRIGWK